MCVYVCVYVCIEQALGYALLFIWAHFYHLTGCGRLGIYYPANALIAAFGRYRLESTLMWVRGSFPWGCNEYHVSRCVGGAWANAHWTASSWNDTSTECLKLMMSCWQVVTTGCDCDSLAGSPCLQKCYQSGHVKTTIFLKSPMLLLWLQTEVCWRCFRVLSSLVSVMWQSLW